MHVSTFLYLCVLLLYSFHIEITNAYMSDITSFDYASFIRVRAKMSGSEISNAETSTSNIITYAEGQELACTCTNDRTNLGGIRVKWIQQKNNKTIFEGIESPTSSALAMRLNTFDNGSRLSCLLLDNNSPTPTNIWSKRLQLDQNGPVEPKTKKKVEMHKTFHTSELVPEQCKKDIYGVQENNRKKNFEIIPKPQLEITKKHDGMVLFCYHRKYLNGTMVERISNIIILEIQKDAPNITPNNTTNYPANNTSNNSRPSQTTSPAISATTTSVNSIEASAAVVGTIILLVVVGLLIFIVRKFVKRKRNQVTQNMEEQTEPVYATPHQVIYAELQLPELSPGRGPKRTKEPYHYAEIKGVLTPKYLQQTK